MGLFGGLENTLFEKGYEDVSAALRYPREDVVVPAVVVGDVQEPLDPEPLKEKLAHRKGNRLVESREILTRRNELSERLDREYLAQEGFVFGRGESENDRSIMCGVDESADIVGREDRCEQGFFGGSSEPFEDIREVLGRMDDPLESSPAKLSDDAFFLILSGE